MGRWLGLIFGNWKRGGASGQGLAPLIRLEVGNLIESLQFNRVKQGAHTRRLSDGTIIEFSANMSGADPILIANVRSGAVEPGGGRKYYMDSGFLELDTDMEIEEGGYHQQNPATRTLYNNYAGKYFTPLYPKEGVDGGAVPPSFINKAKNAFIIGGSGDAYWGTQKPGSYTGKLKWLVAGKYGLKSTNPLWRNVGAFTRRFVSKGRLSGEGIFTDGDNRYWYIRIGSTGYSGTATLLHTPLQGLVDRARRNGVTGDKLTQLETHALALAQKTATVKTVEFSGEEPEGTPLGYGWHFNAGGTKAILVTIEATDIKYEYKSRYYSLSLSSTSNANITLEEETTWQCSAQMHIWLAIESEGGRSHCILDKPITGAGEATDALLYAYYSNSDEIKTVAYSSREETDYEIVDVCGTTGYSDGPIEKYMLTPREWVKFNGDVAIDTLVVDDTTFNSYNGEMFFQEAEGGITSEWVASEGEAWGVCGWNAPGFLYYTEPCTGGLTGWQGPGYPDGFPNCLWRLHERRTSITVFWSGRRWPLSAGVGNDTDQAIALIIPFDCANGVTVIDRDLTNYDPVQHVEALGQSWGYPRTIHRWGYNVDCLGTCNNKTTYDSGKRINGAVPISWTKITAHYYYETVLSRNYFHEGGKFVETKTLQAENLEDVYTDWAIWTYIEPPAECTNTGAVTLKGILTEDVKASANLSLDYDIDGDFPENADLVDGWG